MRQMPLGLSEPARPSLENFLVGDNTALLEHLHSFLRAPAMAQPIYVWGARGSGKTHLLQALAACCREQGLNVSCCGPHVSLPWSCDDSLALVTLDDCQVLSEEQQHAAFVLFNEAQLQGVAFVAAGTLPPADLSLREDLRTRLGWGHVFAVQGLGDEDAGGVLRQEARRLGIELHDDVLNYLLNRFPRDLRSLMDTLQRLDHLGLSLGRRVTVALVRDLLAQA